MKQLAIMTNGDKYKSGDADAEVSRVKAIVIQNSTGKVKVDEILGNQQDRASVEEAVSDISILLRILKLNEKVKSQGHCYT